LGESIPDLKHAKKNPEPHTGRKQGITKSLKKGVGMQKKKPRK